MAGRDGLEAGSDGLAVAAGGGDGLCALLVIVLPDGESMYGVGIEGKHGSLSNHSFRQARDGGRWGHSPSVRSEDSDLLLRTGKPALGIHGGGLHGAARMARHTRQEVVYS